MKLSIAIPSIERELEVEKGGIRGIVEGKSDYRVSNLDMLRRFFLTIDESESDTLGNASAPIELSLPAVWLHYEFLVAGGDWVQSLFLASEKPSMKSVGFILNFRLRAVG